MKIIIKDYEEILTIHDDELENHNFVTLLFENETSEDYGAEVTVSIKELYTAVKAFYEKRERRQKYDNLLDN